MKPALVVSPDDDSGSARGAESRPHAAGVVASMVSTAKLVNEPR